MSYDVGHLVNDLKNLGVQAGDTLLVHSGFKKIHAKSVQDVIEALMTALTPEGTLVMPSFPGGSEFFMMQSGIVFDVRNHPTDCGVIPNTFWKMPGVKRSLNAGHSMAAYGKDADAILAGHENCRVSAGWGSPFEKIIRRGGKILLIGTDHNHNTTLHYVENTHGAPTVAAIEYYPKVITPDGKCITVPTFPHMPGLPRDYAKVEPLLLDAGIQQNGLFGDAGAKLIDAFKMNELIGAMVEKDHTFLIKRFELDDYPPAQKL